MVVKKPRTKTPKGAVALVPESNSRPTTPQKSKPQKPKTKSKSRSSPPPAPAPRRRRTWKAWFFSLILRSSFLYSLYLYIWTCPKDGTDPRRICDIGDRTLDFIEPHLYDAYDAYVEPYYTEYLASYVDKATPYVILANEQYVEPTRVYAVGQFEKHAVPVLLNAKKQVLAEYTRVLEPYVKTAEVKGSAFYDAFLADLVATGQELYIAYSPTVIKYSQQGYDYALEQAHPYYIASLPYIEKAWAEGIAAAGWIGVEGKGWVARRWGMHVEPQLWRIQERLGMKGLKNATPVKEAGPTPPHRGNPNASSSDTTPDQGIKAEGEYDNHDEAVGDKGEYKDGEAPEKKKSSAEQIEDARPLIEADLVAWAAKFEEAATQASAEVVSKLDVLCDKVMKQQTPLSTELLEEFDARVLKEFHDFEDGLLKLLDSPAEHKYVMIGYNGLVGRSFHNMKEKHAQIIAHTQEFLMDTYQSTAKIVDAALAGMDSAHDVGMQELGMKWAWMDGVTYKDWAKYHELKQAFGAMKTRVIRSGQGHKKLREVTDYAKSIDDAAGAILKTVNDEIAKLEKLGRKRLEDAEEARIAAEKADKNGQAVKEDQQSDSPNVKEVPEPEGEKEQPTDPKVDESNHTPDKGQKESEPQQETDPESTNQQQIATEEQPEPESEPASELKTETQDTTSETVGRSEPEAATKEAEPESEPESETTQPETRGEPESKPDTQKEEPNPAVAERAETEHTKDSDTKADERPESESAKQESAPPSQQEPAAEEAGSEANSATEATAEEPSLKVQKSYKEDIAPEANDQEKPVDVPKQQNPSEEEKLIQKDEL
ncbi:hypothetical protein H072_4759 [Dactylellina haptotyla CBS 200.50]|uniref:Uncharacterized protein n=1 Tax=Dactylellina haptotyla (strain CBS 200.50) TaxID=1284197 RepID=S8AJR5_DACHA|nr:hypothetical protein H072_4759 [Dactylellina haptotyla CBS 200.50]